MAQYYILMELTSDRTEIALRLLQNGKYVWTITHNVRNDSAMGSVDFLRELDTRLRDTFPNHVQPSSSKLSTWEE